jgi:hypothetical protein
MSEVISIYGMAKVGDVKKYGLFRASEMYANNWYKEK